MPLDLTALQEKIEQLGGTVSTTPIQEDLSISLEEAFANPEYLKEPKWISPWLCQEKRTTLLVGPPSMAKSWISCADALEAVRRNKATVLYINMDESPADMILRFKNFGDPRIGQAIRIIDPERMELTWDSLHLMMEKHKPSIVYVDSWDRIIGMLEGEVPKAHESTKWRAAIDNFVNLSRRYNAALCILIHTTKADPTVFSGNQQILAGVDISVLVEPAEGKYTRRLSYGKRVVRDPVFLQWQKDTDGTQREISADPPKNLKDEEERVLRILTNGPMGSRLLMTSLGFRDSKFQKVMARLTKRQLVDWKDQNAGIPDTEPLWQYSVTTKGHNELKVFDGKSPSQPVVNLLDKLKQTTGDLQ